jgi:hypothetical protein
MTTSEVVAAVFVGLSEIPNIAVKCNIFVDNFKYSVCLGILDVSEAFISTVLSFVDSRRLSLVGNISDICVRGLEDDINLVERDQIREPEKSVSPNNGISNFMLIKR